MTAAPDNLLVAAAADLDSGLPQQALAKLEGHHEDPDALLLISEALLALGEVDSAHQSFASAVEHLDEQDPDVIWIRAELALADWDLERAARDYQAHVVAAPSSLGLMRLALAYDAMGEHAQADVKEAEARDLEPDLPELVRLSTAEFEAAIEAGRSVLRQRYAKQIEELRIIVEPMPHPGLFGDRPQSTPPDLLGLLVAPASHDVESGKASGSAPAIYLFQRNLERMALAHSELEAEIQGTLFHEFGHLLGLSEDEVRAFGLQ